MKFLTAIFALLSLIFGAVMASDQIESQFRLFTHTESNLPFNPYIDVLKPNAEEAAIEQVEGVVASSVQMSLLPIMRNVMMRADAEAFDPLGGLMTASSILKKSLQKEVKKLETLPKEIFPVKVQTFLVPFSDESGQREYGYDVISSKSYVNLIGKTPGSKRFSDEIIKKISEVEEQIYSSGLNLPVYFLGLRNAVTIDPAQGSKEVLSIILGIKPNENIPFDTKNDQVEINNVEIPKNDLGRGPHLVLNFEFDLSSNTSPPMLKAYFGELERVDNEGFQLKEKSARKMSPKLQGMAIKGGINLTNIEFAFEKIEMNLKTVETTDVDVLIRPGFSFGLGVQYFGGWNRQGIDDQFNGEINKTIQAKMQDALKLILGSKK